MIVAARKIDRAAEASENRRGSGELRRRRVAGTGR
jgi:hypothetical protein